MCVCASCLGSESVGFHTLRYSVSAPGQGLCEFFGNAGRFSPKIRSTSPKFARIRIEFGRIRADIRRVWSNAGHVCQTLQGFGSDSTNRSGNLARTWPTSTKTCPESTNFAPARSMLARSRPSLARYLPSSTRVSGKSPYWARLRPHFCQIRATRGGRTMMVLGRLSSAV